VNEEENPQRDSQAKPQAQPETTPTAPNASMPSKDAGWTGASPTQVMRTVAVAHLTAAVVLGAFFLLWQVRTFIGWFVIALFLAAVLNPAVNWLHRRHRFIKRPLAIALTYLGVLVALLLVVGFSCPCSSTR
jgi:AI-2E family transporter